MWTRQDWRRVPGEYEHEPIRARCFYRLAKTRYSVNNWLAHERIVKMIRSNLLLPWLANRFPVKIVHLIRHPCAVIGSQLRLGWQYDLDDIYAQPLLMNDVLAPYSSWLHTAKTPLEKLAALWCVENVLPLKMARHGLCRSIVYEEYLTQPANVFPGLFGALGLTPTRTTRHAIETSRPHPARDPERLWHVPLTLQEGRRVLEFVNGFDLDNYLPAYYFPASTKRCPRPHRTSRAML